MAVGDGKISGEISLDSQKAIRALNQLIDKLAALEPKGTDAARAIDKVEKSAAGIASALSSGTKSIGDQSKAIEKLITDYRALNKEGLKGTGGITNTLQNAVKRDESAKVLAQQLSDQNKAWATYGRNVIAAQNNVEKEVKASLKRQQDAAWSTYAQNMPKAVKEGQKKAYESYSPNIRASAALEKQLADQNKAWNTYGRNVIAAQKNVENEARASLKRQQDDAFRTYAQNMPAAVKAGQQAAFASYAPNIRAAQQSQQALQGMANQRYALYDVATTLGVVSGALLGVAGASVKTAMSYQTAFAQVNRTTGLSAAGLATIQRQLLDLSTRLPSSFEEISQVGALAGQLNVANNALGDFTETVIMFGSTSNVSMDQSATALARLSQITDAFANDGAASYNKLASAILLTGVNSIATEAQIVAVTTQIATAGDLAGFSADQIIGLASAFSSLNIAPERARGTVQRVFGQITAAVDGGGEALDNFAKVSGRSAEAFAQGWKTNAQGVFTDFIEGLEGAQAAGQDTNAMLKTLGIGAVRDIQALQALANNTEIYTKALEDSGKGYAEGDELGRQYAITAATLSAQFTTLASTMRTALAGMQGGVLSGISGALDIIEKIAKALYEIGQNKAVAAIGVVVLAATALAGVFLAIKVAGALATASMYAMMTAEAGLGKEGIHTTGSINAMAAATAKLVFGTKAATTAQAQFTAAMDAGRGKVVAYTAALRGLAAGANTAATAGKAMRSAFLWTAAISLGITALTHFANKNQEARGRVEELTASLDAQTGAITDLTRTTAAQQLQESGALKTANELGIAKEDLVSAALGEAGAMYKVQNAYDATITKQQAYADTLDYANGMTEEGADALNFLGTAGSKYDKVMDAVGGTARDVAKAVADQAELLDAVGNAGKEAADGVDDFGSSIQSVIDEATAFVSGSLGMMNATYALGQSLADNGKVFDLYSNAGRQNIAALQTTINAMVTASGGDAASLSVYLKGLMQSLVAMGVTGAQALGMVSSALASIPGAAGLAVDLKAVSAASADTTIALNEGYSAAMQKAATTARGASTSAKGFGKSTKDAAKEVRTMKDYVDDLSSVLDRAFELRFEVETARDDLDQTWADIKEGLEEKAEKEPFSFSAIFDKKTYKREGKDAILTAFRDLQEEAAAAAKRVKDAAASVKSSMADMMGLKADRALLEYQLAIAVKYGDALAAQRIQAELAKNDVDRAKAAQDLADAQAEQAQAAQDQNKTLKGNSAAAVNNRNKVRGLLGTYTDYIQSLEDGGASQETINAAITQSTTDFKAQGVALGYSGAELQAYVDVLTSMKTGYANYTDESDKATTSTQNKAQAARDARDAMRDLAQKQQDYIQKLIDSGAPQSTVKQAIKDGKEELKNQATQLGLTKDEAGHYADSLDDITTAIGKVPKNVTVKANLTPIQQALAEWNATKTVKVKATSIDTPKGGLPIRGPAVPTNHNVTVDKIKGEAVPKNRVLTVAQIMTNFIQSQKFYAGTIFEGKSTGGGAHGNIPKSSATGGMVTAGYRARGGGIGFPGGPKGTDTEPYWLTPGEFVQRKAAVDHYGPGFMTALNNMQIPKYLATGGPTTSASVSMPGVLMVELSPTDRQLLAAAGNVTMTVNGKVLATTVNGANVNSTVRNIA